MVTNILILDEKVTSRITDCHGVSSEGAVIDCIATSGPANVHLATDSDAGVGLDECNQSVAAQREDNGRSGGSSDSVNNTGGNNKGSSVYRLFLEHLLFNI